MPSTAIPSIARTGIFASAALVAALALAGCSTVQGFGGGADEPSRDADTQEITESGDADVFTLRPGDCFNDTAAGEIDAVPVVPCAEAHDNEVFASHMMPDGEFPGQDGITAFADANCTPDFETFVGTAWEESSLEWFPITPTQGSWESAGDREVLCAVWDPAGQVEGTLAGAAR